MWAFSRVCTRGNSGLLVECIRIDDAPDPEIIWFGMTAREKMSVGCASLIQLAENLEWVWYGIP